MGTKIPRAPDPSSTVHKGQRGVLRTLSSCISQCYWLVSCNSNVAYRVSMTHAITSFRFCFSRPALRSKLTSNTRCRRPWQGTTVAGANAQASQQLLQTGEEPAAPPHELDPACLLSQPSCQQLLSVLRSYPANVISSRALGAALSRTAGLLSGFGSVPAGEQAAVEELLLMGWARVDTLSPAALVSLLQAASAAQLCSPTLIRLWLVAFRAGKGLRMLRPAEHVQLLGSLRRLFASRNEQCRAAYASFPRQLLYMHLERATLPQASSPTSPTLTAGTDSALAPSLSLPQLAQLFGAVCELSLRLSLDQQQRLLAATRNWLAEAPEKHKGFGLHALRELIVQWTRLEREYVRFHRNPEAAAAKHAEVVEKKLWSLRELDQARREEGGQQQQQQQYETPPGQLSPPMWSGQQEGSRAVSLLCQQDHLPALSGYPGDDVMEMILEWNLAGIKQGQVGAAGLSHLLRGLGVFRYKPPPEVLKQITAALEPQLVGAGRAPEVTAALGGLAMLGFDPGASFLDACLRVVDEDGGRDIYLLCRTAHALAVLEQCTPQRWARLMHLLEARITPALRHRDLRRALHPLMTAYSLVKGHYSSSTPGGDGTAEIVPLRPELLQLGMDVLCTDMRAEGTKLYIPLGVAAAKTVEDLCGPGFQVLQSHRILDPGRPGAVQLADLAVPQLRFAVLLSRPASLARNTGEPLAAAQLVTVRMLRYLGWHAVLLPPAEVLLHRQEPAAQGSLHALWVSKRPAKTSVLLQQAVRSYLLQESSLPQLLQDF